MSGFGVTDMGKFCVACAHVAGRYPTTCGKFRDPVSGRPLLAWPLRLAGGRCGEHGGAYEPDSKLAGAKIIAHPAAHRESA